MVLLSGAQGKQVFVEEGCDVTILNDDGVSAVTILRQGGGDKEALVLANQMHLQWNLTASEMQ